MGRQIWHPDTCGCVVEYDIDPATGITSNPAWHRRCPDHAGLSAPVLHATLFDENPRRNKLEEKLRADFPAIFGQTDPQSGTVTFKRHVFACTWTGSGASRVLTIDTQGQLTTNQKNTAQTWCNTNLGVGKVAIL